MSDTSDIQAIIDNAPPGTVVSLDQNRQYVISPGASNIGGIVLRNSYITLNLNGSTLVAANNVPVAFSTVMVTGPGCRVLNGTLLGPVTGGGEHQHGLWVQGAGFVGSDIVSNLNRGDGIYCYTGADGVTLRRCITQSNFRNGVTAGGAISGMMVDNLVSTGNLAQQFDVEPDSSSGIVVNNLVINGSILDCMQSTDYAVTLGDKGRNHKLINSTINGGIFMPWADSVDIIDCNGTNRTSKGCVEINRASTRINISRCNFMATVAKRAILCEATAGGSPDAITIIDTNLTTQAPGACAIENNNAISLHIERCQLQGNGTRAAQRGGIMNRATILPPGQMKSVTIIDTNILDFGEAAVVCGGNSAVLADGTKIVSSIYRVTALNLSHNMPIRFLMDNTVQHFVSDMPRVGPDAGGFSGDWTLLY